MEIALVYQGEGEGVRGVVSVGDSEIINANLLIDQGISSHVELPG